MPTERKGQGGGRNQGPTKGEGSDPNVGTEFFPKVPPWATPDQVRDMISSEIRVIEKSLKEHEAVVGQKLSALDKLNQYPTTSVLAAYIGTTALALIIFVIAMLQLTGDRWDNGIGVGKQMEQTNHAIEDINKKMDRLIEDDAKKK